MSYKILEAHPSMGKAEIAFREAFDRLKSGKPNLLPKGATVTQNNVAREAGLDSSALKKTRFPALVAEIQNWIGQNDVQQVTSPTKSITTKRNRNRSLQEQIEILKAQRDNALALLVDADARIVALIVENQRLQTARPKSNVSQIIKPAKLTPERR